MEEITLSKFQTEKDVIQNLDLTPFLVKIKLSSVPTILTSLFKVLFLKLFNFLIKILL